MLLSPHSNTIILSNELMIVSKDDVDNSENASSEKVTSRLSNHFYMVITLAKCVLIILKVNWSQRFRDKRKFVHKTAKYVISRRRKDEKGK